MGHNPFQVVIDFERAVAQYTGAPYVVAVNSCTSALLLALAWHFQGAPSDHYRRNNQYYPVGRDVEIPKRTYLSVPMSIIHAGGRPTFRDEDWHGAYQLKPLNVWDSARHFTSGMFIGMGSHGDSSTHVARNIAGQMICTSHHWAKTLGIQQGGCILHDNPEADAWLRRARFDGRTEGVAPKDDNITMVGWHCYMSPETAALGLVRMSHIPLHNDPLPLDDYPDLSTLEIFK